MIVNFFLGILNSPPHDEFLCLVKAAFLLYIFHKRNIKLYIFFHKLNISKKRHVPELFSGRSAVIFEVKL